MKIYVISITTENCRIQNHVILKFNYKSEQKIGESIEYQVSNDTNFILQY